MNKQTPRFVVILFFALVAITSYAQNTITGTITDNESGEALIGANVIIEGTTDGTITDFDGNFSLTTTRELPFNVEISYTGFGTILEEITQPNQVLDIALSSGLLFSEEVIVSASRRKEKVQEAPASVSVIGARQLETSPNSTDATRNLVNTAGVQVQQQSANRINISMRGGSGLFGTSVFPIYDYRSLVGPGIGTFQSDQAGIMTLDLNNIEVVRGPGSALYGPGVTQGVVHFLSKSPIDQPGTSFELIGGELSTYGGAIRQAFKFSDKAGLKFNVQHRRGNEFNYNPQDSTDAAYIAQFLPNQGMGRGLYRPNIVNETVAPTGAMLIKSFDQLDEDGDGNPIQDDWYNTSVNTTLELRPTDQLSLNFSGGMNQASSIFFNEQGPGQASAREYWGQARVQAGGLFAQVFYVDNNGGFEDDPTFLYKTGNVTSIARDQLEGQLQYNFDIPKFLGSNWTAGGDYRRSGQDTEHLTYGRNEDDDTYTVYGGYLQGKFGLGNKVDLVLAGRYDYFKFLSDGAFAPRAALVFKVSPKHTIRTAYNRANSTVTNLQYNIDFPLSTIIPGSFDAWLYGNKTEQTFGDNPTIDWFNGSIPSLPVGTPGAGLPLGVITNQEVAPGVTFNQAVIAQLAQGLGENPMTAPAVPIVTQVLAGLNPATLGFGGALSPGFNIFDESPLGLIDAPESVIQVTDNIEIGYKGLIGDRLGVSIDGYWVNEKNNSQFTAISPAYKLTGIDGISSDLGGAVQGQAQPLIEGALIQAGFDPTTAAATAAALGGIINGAYTAGADGFLNTPSPTFGGATFNQVLNALPFHATTPTEQVPQDGVTHLAAGYRTFEPRDYFGSDVGLQYFVNDALTFFGNYSWVSDIEFMQRVIGTGDSAPLPTYLNIPQNKFRLGMTLAPEHGVQAQIAFQHDDEFFASAGDFTGLAPEKNLVDASLGYRFENGLGISVSATNLFDNNYRYYQLMPVIGRRVLGRVTYSFGGNGPTDFDGDGISDKKDACPNVRGLKEFGGCPDSDSDGIIDTQDECPMVAGSTAMNGCPDGDGDGFADKHDECPNQAGPTRGCPDRDGDGETDAEEDARLKIEKAEQDAKLAEEARLKAELEATKAREAAAAEEARLAAEQAKEAARKNEIRNVATELFTRTLKGIEFQSGSANLKTTSRPILDEVVSLMVRYPEVTLKIDGHTDSQGAEASNLQLSQRRADSVMKYLVEHGVNGSRLSAQGFGESQPIAPNTTAAGRAQNRRVELRTNYN